MKSLHRTARLCQANSIQVAWDAELVVAYTDQYLSQSDLQSLLQTAWVMWQHTSRIAGLLLRLLLDIGLLGSATHDVDMQCMRS